MNIHHLEIIAAFIVGLAFLALAVLYKLAMAENLKLREELAVAKVWLDHRAEEIERCKDRIAFEQKMRAHADKFLEQVKEWIFEESEPAPSAQGKPKGFYYLDPETFEVKWKQTELEESHEQNDGVEGQGKADQSVG
jgi:hypothetical protein